MSSENKPGFASVIEMLLDFLGKEYNRAEELQARVAELETHYNGMCDNYDKLKREMDKSISELWEKEFAALSLCRCADNYKPGKDSDCPVLLAKLIVSMKKVVDDSDNGCDGCTGGNPESCKRCEETRLNKKTEGKAS